MSHSAEKDARPSVDDYACTACGAAEGVPCEVRLSGVDTTGWSHDARILAPVIADLRARVNPPTTPDCTCSAGNDAEFAAQHATLCPRFAHPRVFPPATTEADS